MSELEDYFKTNLENYQIEPSQKVWKNINRKLMIKRFFTPNFRQFNVYYLGAIVGVVAFGVFFYNADNKQISINQIAISKQSDRVLVRSGQQNNIIDLQTKQNSSFLENNNSQSIASNVSKDTFFSNNNSNNLEVQLGKSIIPNKIYHQPKNEIIAIPRKESKEDYSKENIIKTNLQIAYNTPQTGHPEIFMIANRDKDANYIWKFGNNTIRYGHKVVNTFESRGEYTLTLIAQSKDYIDTLVSTITVEDPQYNLKFANALKQNSQYENYFRPLGDVEKIESYHLVIYNKIGKVVFSSDDYNERFDGKQYGKDLPIGVYIYRCVATFINGQKMNYNGNLTIY